jgi:glycerol-3-phosphate dehydrogenase
MMNRTEGVERVLQGEEEPWEILIIGGGATGVGAAVDAASRGFRVLLVEQSDFGKGTSSRSTKLIHGGVRYLQQGNISLVMEALKERGILLKNAPHLVHDMAFVVPNYDWWEAPFYGIGMKVYDMLARQYGFNRSRLLSSEEVRKRIPTVAEKGLRGGVLYHDGQFDDARLLINLVQTAARQGATVLNYCPCVGFSFDEGGFVDGAVIRDLESGRERTVRARCVINATGAFTDAVLRMADPEAPELIAPSQGVHVVLDRSFLPGDTAIMVPRTSDGRVLFAIPWHHHALLGTTDTPIEAATLEPRPLDHEIEFILSTAGEYLLKAPTRDDVLSVFAGIRPLVKADEAARTASLSREHTIHIDRYGLLSIFGGKWTTYRRMAEDCIDHAITLGRLEDRPCITRTLNIHGYHRHTGPFGDLAYYGSDAPALRNLMRKHPELSDGLHPAIPFQGGQVVWAVRMEMARTVDDVLARRTRVLQLNARAALDLAPAVARIMAEELGRDAAWQRAQVEEFRALAEGYLPAGASPPAPASLPDQDPLPDGESLSGGASLPAGEARDGPSPRPG